jgi:hypothetical protein
MAIIFENPNSPQQPQKGIYGWYAQKGNNTIPIYIGQAGYKDTCLPKGTLFRGVSELQRNTFTSNSPTYDILDTDFIVGTAIKYFEQVRGYNCIWRHVSDDPSDERQIVSKEKPILQNINADILDKFKKIKSSTNRWKLTPASVAEAEKKLFQQLSEYK